jgi:hypothetical protein
VVTFAKRFLKLIFWPFEKAISTRCGFNLNPQRLAILRKRADVVIGSSVYKRGPNNNVFRRGMAGGSKPHYLLPVDQFLTALPNLSVALDASRRGRIPSPGAPTTRTVGRPRCPGAIKGNDDEVYVVDRREWLEWFAVRHDLVP